MTYPNNTPSQHTINERYILWLKTPDGGSCSHVKILGEGIYAAIKPLLFHWTMIVGMIDNKIEVLDSYCYANQDRALLALIQWNGKGDPVGWTRHPRTGRRRPNGLQEGEYISF